MNNNLQISTRVRRLFSYLKDFENGNIQVPPFQRDFVWTNKQKIELFDSIKKGYPIGSILFWRPDNELVKKLSDIDSQMVGAYKLPEKNADFFYILDGYQRLSTLFGSLVNPTKTNLKRNEEEWKKGFDIIYNLEEDRFLFKRGKAIHKIHEVPLFKFIDGQEFYEFQTELIRLNIPDEKVKIYLSRYKNFGTKISSYDIPSIDLIGGSIKEAVDIFSRLNSRGSKVSNDWKISALSYDKGFRLGTEIDKLFKKIKQFNYFNNKGDKKTKRKLILQCITNSFGDIYFDTLSKNDQSTLEKIALRDDFISTTKKTFIAIEQAVKFLFEELNVLSSKLLPYNSHFIFITDFFNKIEKPNKKQLESLKQWFWITTYSNYFTRYNLSKQRLAYQRFQAFIEDENESPIYYDKKGEAFETAEFPVKISMGSVRAKALVLFMLNYQGDSVNKELEIKNDSYRSYKLFSSRGNITENTVFEKNVPNYIKRNIPESPFGFSRTPETNAKLFITKEMIASYDNEIHEKEILNARKQNIIKHEKEFVKSLGLRYIE